MNMEHDTMVLFHNSKTISNDSDHNDMGNNRSVDNSYHNNRPNISSILIDMDYSRDRDKDYNSLFLDMGVSDTF